MLTLPFFSFPEKEGFQGNADQQDFPWQVLARVFHKLIKETIS
jgi:hypothetical protein